MSKNIEKNRNGSFFWPTLYDKTKLSNFLLYLDANNLYGWAMIQALPYGEFEFITEVELEMKKNDKSFMRKRGFIYNVDLKYTEECKKKTFKYPLCPESKAIKTEELYPRQHYYNKNNKFLKKLINS